MEYLATLGFIGKFLSPAISDSIKERIKPKSSEDIAKKRALRLYESLGKLDRTIDSFVKTFDDYQKASEPQDSDGPGERLIRMFELTGEVDGRTEDIVCALLELEESLEAINPQLEIHKPELVNILEVLGVHERFVAEEIRAIEDKLFPWNAPDPEFLAVLEEARKNRNILHSAIKEYREFISKEFPFKESF